MTSWRASSACTVVLVCLITPLASCHRGDPASSAVDEPVRGEQSEAEGTPAAQAEDSPAPEAADSSVYALDPFVGPRYWTRLAPTAAIDGEGSLYVTDHRTIFRVSPDGEVEPFLEPETPVRSGLPKIEALAALPSGTVFFRDSLGCFYVVGGWHFKEVFFPRRSDEPTKPEPAKPRDDGLPEGWPAASLSPNAFDRMHGIAPSAAYVPPGGSQRPIPTRPERVLCDGVGRMPDSEMAALDEDTLVVIDRQGLWRVREDGREEIIDCVSLGNGACGPGDLAVNRFEGTYFYARGYNGADVVGGHVNDRFAGLVAKREDLALEPQWYLASMTEHPSGGVLINMARGLIHLRFSGEKSVVKTRPPLGLFAHQKDDRFESRPIVLSADGSVLYLVGETRIYRGREGFE